LITITVDNGVYETGMEVPDNIHPVVLEKLVGNMIPDNIPSIVLIEQPDDDTLTIVHNIPEGVN
jgi:hypothetical protein